MYEQIVTSYVNNKDDNIHKSESEQIRSSDLAFSVVHNCFINHEPSLKNIGKF